MKQQHRGVVEQYSSRAEIGHLMNEVLAHGEETDQQALNRLQLGEQTGRLWLLAVKTLQRWKNEPENNVGLTKSLLSESMLVYEDLAFSLKRNGKDQKCKVP